MFNEVRKILYEHEVNPDKPIYGPRKLCLSDQELWTQYTSRGKLNYFHGPLNLLEDMGSVFLNGYDAYREPDQEAFVLSDKGLYLMRGREIDDNFLAIQVGRMIHDDSLPLRDCRMTIDGEELPFFGEMSHGNPELPEESEDFIERWEVSYRGRKVEGFPFFVLPDPKILSLLNFDFLEPRSIGFEEEWD